MAAVACAYNNLIPNGAVADVGLVTAAAVAGVGNGVKIPSITPGSIRSFPELTLLRVVNGATPGNAVVKAGPNPPALAGGQGDLTVAVAASATQWIGPFESGRFLQSDGSMVVETTQAMTVTAFKVPRNT
jgi:hypothetical protein